MHRLNCVGFACPRDAKNGTQNTVIPVALATGHCELRTESVVSEVIVDDHGRARGVKYFDAAGRLNVQTADVVVVSASATETARLLLNSRSKLFPRGAGNNHDWVGRNLQGHAYTGACGYVDTMLYDGLGPGACVAFCDFNHGNPGIRGGGLLANEFIALPYLFTHIRPPGSPRWGRAIRTSSGGGTSTRCASWARSRKCPSSRPASRSIPPSRTTGAFPWRGFRAGGTPATSKRPSFSPRRRRPCSRKRSPGRRWTNVPGLGLSGGQHQAGTCRMGNDPKTSVTNRYGQIHQIDNLFVADGSLHVTNGGFNPSLTIMALGYWVGGYIAREWKGTRFRSK